MGSFAIATVNASGWTPVQQFLDETEVQAVMVQEHKLYRNQLVDIADQQRKRGWGRLATPAITKVSGPSAGVLVAVRAGIDAGLPLEPAYFPENGRFKAVKIGSYLPGGLLLVSIYFRAPEGLPDGNLQLLWDLEIYLAGLQLPWIVAGDWNLLPSDVQGSGIPQRLGASLVATGAPHH